MVRSSAGSPTSCHTSVADTANEASIASDARPPDTRLRQATPEHRVDDEADQRE